MYKIDKQFIRKVRRKDRIATGVIKVGGMVIIASVIAILVLIVKVAFPLFMPAQAREIGAFKIPDSAGTPIAIGIGDYQEVAYVLGENGDFTFYNIKDGSNLITFPMREGSRVKGFDFYRNSIYTLLWEDHAISVVRVDYRPLFDGAGKRSIEPLVTVLDELTPRDYQSEPIRVASRRSDEERLTTAALLKDGRIRVDHLVKVTDLFDNETSEEYTFLIDEQIKGAITTFVLDDQGMVLYAGTDQGSLARWDLADNSQAVKTDEVDVESAGADISSMAMVFGELSIAVGDMDGNLSTFSHVWTGGEQMVRKLRKTHILRSHDGAVIHLTPSRRTKSLVSLSDQGIIHFDHMTSENALIRLEGNTLLFGFAGRGNGLITLDKNNLLKVWNIDNPHPEINLKALFGKVWYESYQNPEYVWQSSSGNDDFEPKFSVVPLLFGTIKGTFYAMLFAIPLSIFGAVYTSQFTTPAFKKSIKPIIEIMASIPSVVIGFLIALWLAPIVERSILAVLICLVMVPLLYLVFMIVLQPLYKNSYFQNRCMGYEFLLLMPIIILATAISIGVAPMMESVLFGGNFKLWLYNDVGMRYDQRNCLIIAFGLGIAVIPVIFSMTEDAISNIPHSLTAASLALSASRWQTIWRVVLPSASPGIFAAIMIGFGRAVGETMIVLMATGNTPILDWSIFTGMRTLSANIAVEIPEAPVAGTLYRVLFLCATLLFVLTFILNTGAEIIRERLRKKYVRY
ncbi:MAG: ABC transporter permease subunit [Proteobacteria bacterium]|nr:ABC transporter permease subunit [Pseudomonadota bacterium]MBU1736824.1 ABC transporter permease subunit [Pseudomonadota bacterium]